jgi:hypothetical protein
MSLIAECTLDSPLLREALTAVPEMRVHYENETIPNGRPARFVFRADGGEFDAFEAAMDRDPSVADWAFLASVDEQRLYRVDIAREVESELTYTALVELDGFVIGATGAADGWSVRIQFPDREALSTYRDACLDAGLSFELENLYCAAEAADFDARLTGRQREALEAALELGYFQIPRQVSTAELGDELDVTGQAVSERLRRALATAAEMVLDDDRHGG